MKCPICEELCDSLEFSQWFSNQACPECFAEGENNFAQQEDEQKSALDAMLEEEDWEDDDDED